MGDFLGEAFVVVGIFLQPQPSRGQARSGWGTRKFDGLGDSVDDQYGAVIESGGAFAEAV